MIMGRMLPSTMLKFIDEPLALEIPGLRRYVQNFAQPDERPPTRCSGRGPEELAVRAGAVGSD
jgi:hypothetical protein